MKLVIQIPCFNETETLPITLKALPTHIEGIDTIERLIIDDGSTDGTSELANKLGVEHIVRLPRNQGLARAFLAGLDGSLAVGADIIVNTDADNQYCADDIEKLVRPILEKRAEIVIGARPIMNIPHFSPAKKFLQRIGSWAVRMMSRTLIPDAPSGFRAFSRDAAMKMNVFNEYTYTLETIIQAGQKNMAIISVPIRVNGDLRPSRLVKSIPSYIRRSLVTMVRIFLVYRPVRVFMFLAALSFFGGFLISARFVTLYIQGQGQGMVQSLILASFLMGSGVLLGMVGILADLIAVNRKLLEDANWRLRRLEDSVEGIHSSKAAENSRVSGFLDQQKPLV